ncbi:uncharacterized protein cubi_01022 [Cryptosporidium ubiquitum]|uniref:Uncharacterized protein n=1 Tax=Cryptosporidium ubiquitum TaxID=857276 RepID=A0A1J4MDD2_9CRYT|nr:uncharacterized protein cubi_01022 [Cryptosporidium ubiquitum]OII70877.1 hypothetical protein cubi_01022 [Cryptosporidium ubiquitum]
MHKQTEDLFFPASINVDLTISRCKKKLAGLRNYIKSTSYPRNQINTRFLREPNDYNIKNNKHQVYLAQNEKYRDMFSHLNERKLHHKLNTQNVKNYNPETNVCSEIDSESSLSYNNSFVNKLIERYYSTSKSRLPDLNNQFEANNLFQSSNNLFTPKLRKNDERKEDTLIYQDFENKSIKLNSVNTDIGSYCDPKFGKDCKSSNKKKNIETQKSPNVTLLKQCDLETREIVDNLDKKIKNLERKIKTNKKNDFQKQNTSEYLERSNCMESKLLSISVIPPYGISCFESSFLPYYCTLQEIQILKDLISIKGEIFNPSKTKIEVISIGKMFCCHARTRFIDSIKHLYQGSLNVLKLKLLIYIEEPEILLVNTFGPQPIENKGDIYFYELEAIYEMKKISRFMICLLITEKPVECFTKRRYTISNAKQVLPIYIIDVNSTSK